MMAQVPYGARRIASALDPACIPIDGRDSRDRLAFVAAYARLILYVNNHNQVDGNWQAFFMKDPSILLAHVSSTDYEACHARFILFDESLKHSSTNETTSVLINQLCDLLKEMFSTINSWLRFMKLQAASHHLRKFLEKKIRDLLAMQLCLFITLRQRLSSLTKGAVAEPDTPFFRSFEPIWYERALNLTALAAANASSIEPFVAALRRIYHVTFNVVGQSVEYAKKAFYELETEPSHFPDTALMIVFSRLMASQSDEINKLGRKHLDFYYDRILHQHLRPASPDQVFVSLRLSDSVERLSLPAGTLFRAGQYPDQSDILFCTEAEEALTHAAISSVFTLFYGRASRDHASANLNLNRVQAPDQVNRNALHEIATWEAFGNARGLVVEQGFALASPMLLLQSGHRTITIDFTLDGLSPLSLPDTGYFLSTAAGWFAVRPTMTPTGSGIVVKLQPADPAIVPLAKNPDGYESVWPLLKVVLGATANLLDPPLIGGVNISVQVDAFSTFSLANDLSPLPATGPQAIFGPVPQTGAHFYVGSNECFAKPLSRLTLTVNWVQPLPDFSAYYSAYNHFLAPTDPAPSEPFNNKAFTGLWTWLNQKDWKPVDVFVPLRTPPPPQSAQTNSTQTQPTAEAAPVIEPKVLKRLAQVPEKIFQCCKKLVTGAFSSRGAKSEHAEPSGRSPLEAAGANAPTNNNQPGSLFQMYDGVLPSAVPATTTLCPDSTFLFMFDPTARMDAKPSLALGALPPVSLASDGYLCFELQQPRWAFGNSLYTKVVAQVSLNNAQWLIQEAKGFSLGKLITGVATLIRKALTPLAVQPACATGPQPLPNLPYVPRQAAATGSYAASTAVTIDPSVSDTAPYPLEIYHYGSFKPYLAWDSKAPATGTGFDTLTPKPRRGAFGTDPKLKLFPGVGGQGCLYVSLAGVQAPCTLTLYAEISADESCKPPGDGDVGYYTWGNTGWQPLTVLLDDTGNLSHSGILRFEIPLIVPPPPPDDLPMTPVAQEQQSSAQRSQSHTPSPIMPNSDFWLAIATNSDGINVKVSYLNTQTIRLIRCAMSSLPPGEMPTLEANTISATKNKIAQITSITQPFASFGGKPAEQRNSFTASNSFYRRVSARLNNKDRVVSNADLVAMAHEADAGLYCARVLPGGPGQARIGLVQGYANAQLPNAFRPNVGGTAQEAIRQHIARGVSAQTQLALQNLKHQVVTVYATIFVASSADVGEMSVGLNQSIRLYLSPWIATDLPQASLGQTINQSALIGYLASRKGVLSVCDLRLVGAEPLNDESIIFVSAKEHVLRIEPVGAPHAYY
jgi:hypothetical protein